MTLPNPAFRNSDERDEAGWRIRGLSQAAATLAGVRSEPTMAGYRLWEARTDAPLLPPQDELETALEAIERATACLLHSYDRRRRFDDPPVHAGSITDLDNEHPF